MELAIGIIVLGLIGLWLASKLSRNSGERDVFEGRKLVVVSDPSGEYDTDIVGEAHYQAALDTICGGKTEKGHQKEVTAFLITQDSNPHDSQAVAVMIQGQLVGYLSREHARRMRREMSFPQGFVLQCPAMIVGGWKRNTGSEGSYGVKLDLG